MQIRDIMTRPVELAAPDDSIRVAARKMTAMDCGILPVGEDNRLVGMLTDRDIVTRAVAEGYDPDECFVRAIMSPDVMYCYEDETPDDLARNMAGLQVKRMPVLNRDKRLVGIVSLGDLALGSVRRRKRWPGFRSRGARRSWGRCRPLCFSRAPFLAASLGARSGHEQGFRQRQ